MTTKNFKEHEKVMRKVKDVVKLINGHSEEDREVLFSAVVLELLEGVEIKNGHKIGSLYFAIHNYINAILGKQASDVLFGFIAEQVKRVGEQ